MMKLHNRHGRPHGPGRGLRGRFFCQPEPIDPYAPTPEPHGGSGPEGPEERPHEPQIGRAHV